jgi:hypothetical protein
MGAIKINKSQAVASPGRRLAGMMNNARIPIRYESTPMIVSQSHPTGNSSRFVIHFHSIIEGFLPGKCKTLRSQPALLGVTWLYIIIDTFQDV